MARLVNEVSIVTLLRYLLNMCEFIPVLFLVGLFCSAS